MNRWITEGFQGSETTVYDTVTLDTCHYTFVQYPQNAQHQAEPSKLQNLGVMCQCRFINCNKCITLVENIYNVRGYACVGAGDIC